MKMELDDYLGKKVFGILENDEIDADRKLSQIKKIVFVGGNLDVENEKGTPLLHMVIKKNENKILGYLIEKKVNLKVKDKKGDNALIVAVRAGNQEAVEILLGKISVEKTDDKGWTPLMIASAKGDLEIVKCLVEKGYASVDSLGFTKELNSALFFATENKHHKVMKYLIENEADVNLDNKEDETPLMKSVVKNDFEGVKILVENGADVNAKDCVSSVLVKGVKSGNIEMVEYLIEKGADVNDKVYGDFTPLMHAYKEGDEWMVKMLEAKGAKLKETNYFGENVLWCAIESGNVELVKKLKKNGFDLNGFFGDKGVTPLMRAVEIGEFEVAKFLVESGVSLNVKNKKGQTALGVISTHGAKEHELIKMMLEKGALVSANTAFDVVVICRSFGGSAETVELLKEYKEKEDISLWYRLKKRMR